MSDCHLLAYTLKSTIVIIRENLTTLYTVHYFIGVFIISQHFTMCLFAPL